MLRCPVSFPANHRSSDGAWLTASLLVMTAVAVADGLMPNSVLLTEFLALGPALASIRLSPGTTALLVVVAQVLGLGLGLIDAPWGSPDHWIAHAGILLFGAVSVLVAHRRHSRERSLAESEERRIRLMEGLPNILDLESSVAALRATLEATADGLLVADSQGRILLYNRKFLEMWGLPEEIAASKDDERARSFVLDKLADPEGFLNRIGELFRLNPPESFDTIEFRDGRVFERYSQPHSISREHRGRVWSFRDVTSRRNAAAESARMHSELERASENWQATFDAVESAILILDPDGGIRNLNRSAAALLESGDPGLSRIRTDGSWLIEPWLTAARLRDELIETRRGAMRTIEDTGLGRSWEVEVRFIDAGRPAPERTLVLIRDITRIVDLQQTLLRSESISAMGSLVAGVAHEVRNPLFTISASIDAFEARFGGSPEESRYLAVLRGGVNRLSALMEQLLDYGKPSPYFPTRADLAELIRDAVETLSETARNGGVTIEVRESPGLPQILVDRGRLVQVFQNLILNALQHSAPGGRVIISTAAVQEPGRAWIDCTVEDEGPGFAAEVLPRVFEPFFSGRQDGTGLGLSIVRRIVDQLGGYVTASNRPETGALLLVRLPHLVGGTTKTDGQ